MLGSDCVRPTHQLNSTTMHIPLGDCVTTLDCTGALAGEKFTSHGEKGINTVRPNSPNKKSASPSLALARTLYHDHWDGHIHF